MTELPASLLNGILLLLLEGRGVTREVASQRIREDGFDVAGPIPLGHEFVERFDRLLYPSLYESRQSTPPTSSTNT
jgi:hypothetical protein